MRKSITAGILLIITCLLLPSVSKAITITVTNTNDTGAGSFRQAVLDAVDGDVINFSVTGNIAFTSGVVSIDKSITITGPGSDLLSFDGISTNSILYFLAGNSTISGLTLKHGYGTYGAALSTGVFAVVNVIDCVFSLNHSSTGGGAIFNEGELIMDSCSLLENSTSGTYGGGMYNFGGIISMTNCIVSGNIANVGVGGGICNEGGDLNITNSTIHQNTAASGAGISNESSGNAVLNGCTIWNNLAYFYGAGMNTYNSFTELTNCTISGNTANTSGGGLSLFTNFFSGSLSLMNVTIADNVTGVLVDAVTGSAQMTMTNTIFLNDGGDLTLNGIATLISNGHNISGDGTMTSILTNTGDQLNTDALLLPLSDNGGGTQTHALNLLSTAIDAGTTTLAPTVDQRGVLRDATPDIGAYEYCAPVSAPGVISGLTTVCPGSTNTYSISAVSGATSYTWTLPGGWVGTSTTTSIDVTANSTGGDISVTANNACGASAPTILTITTAAAVDVSTSLSGITISANNVGGGVTYQWYDCTSGTNIAGETSVDYTPTSNGDYAVIVNDGACSDTSSCVTISEVSLNENTSVSISLYPNPTTGEFTLTIGASAIVTISDATGRVVYTDYLSAGKNDLNLSGYECGVYFVRVDNVIKQLVVSK